MISRMPSEDHGFNGSLKSPLPVTLFHPFPSHSSTFISIHFAKENDKNGLFTGGMAFPSPN